MATQQFFIFIFTTYCASLNFWVSLHLKNSMTANEPGNKNKKEGMETPIDFYTKWPSSLASTIVHWPPLYSLTKNARFCEPGVVTFSRRHLLFVCRRTSRKLLRENWWGSRQLRMLTWFSVICSLFQFLLLLIIFWVKKFSMLLTLLVRP